MAEIEMLTPETRVALARIDEGSLALRIIEQQAVEIVRLGEDLAQLRERVSKALGALDATRYLPSGPLDEWALSSEGRNLGYVMVALTALRGQGTPHVQTQAAPTPDYRSEVERCSCEEALALREELGAASRELKQLADRIDNAEQRVAEQRERIRQDCIAAEERAAEVAALRAERQERESTVLDYAKECADLRAEVERLRAELESAERGQRDAVKAVDDNWVTHQRVIRAERQFAAANAEVESLREHRERLAIEAGKLRGEYSQRNAREAELRAEVERLRAQLPIQMPNCSILFKECPVGHGWLTATNWVDSGCMACQLNTANALVSEVLDTPSVTLVDWVAWGKRARAHLANQPAVHIDPDETDDERQELAAGRERAQARSDQLEAMGRDMARCQAGLKPIRTAAEQGELVSARDDLRSMFRRWHTSGVHATYDAPTIERAILALDTELARREGT